LNNPTPAPDRAERTAHWLAGDAKRILVAQVVFGFAWSHYLLMPKFLTTALHAPPDVLGRISAMGGLAGLLTVPFAARGLDRLGRKPFFSMGSALLVLLSLGYMQVREVSPLVYVLQGLVSASFVLSFNAAAALLTDYAPPDRMGQAIGWLGSCNVLMNAIATMLAEPLAAAHGWHAVFIMAGVAGLVSFGMSFTLRDAPVQPQPSASKAPPAPALRLGPLLPMLTAALLAGASFNAIFGFVQPYAVSLGAKAVSGFYLGYTISAVLGRVFFGGLGDRIGRRSVSMWMLGGYALCSLAVRELHPDLLLVYGLMFGAAHGILYPTLNALLLEVLPSARRGLGMVLFNGAFNVGMSAGGFAWGELAKGRGYPSVYSITTVAALVAGGVLLFTRPRSST
jgi:MFS family permease